MWIDYLIAIFEVSIFFNIISALIIIFFEKRKTSDTWAWLMLLIFIPYVGFLIYLIVGLDIRKNRTFIAKSKNDEHLYKKYLSLETSSNDIKNKINLEGFEHYNDLVHLNSSSDNGFLTTNNAIEFYNDGNLKFEKLINDIKQAKKFVFIEYYIVKSDELGKKVVDALTEVAKKGVEIKFIIDAMGSQFSDKKMYKDLISAGGKVGVFLPPTIIRLNYRNHRKICIIDGQIGYIGGFNIGNEYLGKSKKFGNWRDSHIRIVGDSINNLTLRFIMDWNFCSNYAIDLNSKYFVKHNKTDEGVKIQVVSSGPDTKLQNIKNSYFKMICEAEKSIFIQTPYFVPDEGILEAIKIQALSGIDIKIVIPGKPDHPFVYWASLSNMGKLLECGVKCYQYNNGFLHSKFMMVDGFVSSVGTANMDIRSFSLNFEINAFVFDKNTTKIFEESFIRDLEDCTEITLESYKNRSTRTKIKESISRLISPLL